MGLQDKSNSGFNKASSLQKARKTLIPRLGGWEVRILEYALSESRRFAATDILIHYHGNVRGRERYRLLRRIHDSIKRLERRGLVRKVMGKKRVKGRITEVPVRGLYEATSDVDSIYLPHREPTRQGKAVDSTFFPLRPVCGGVPASVLVFRVHCSFGAGGGLAVSLYERLVALEVVVSFARRAVEDWLIGNDVSRSFVRRVRAGVRRLVRGVLGRGPGVLVGVHGFRDYWSGRSVRSFVPLSALRGVKFRFTEVGVDVVVESEAAGVVRDVVGFTKVYAKAFPSLESYART